MSVLLDVLGSVIIAGTLLLMMMTFQLHLQEASTRLLYTGSMIEHMDKVARDVNHVFSMVGIGFGATDTVMESAKKNSVRFKTFWDYTKDELSQSEHTVEIKINDTGDSFGRVLNVVQDGNIVYPLGHILYIEDMQLKYYNRADQETAVLKDIMSAEVLLTFRRDSPWRPDRPLRSNLQLKCYFMNRYLQLSA